MINRVSSDPAWRYRLILLVVLLGGLVARLAYLNFDCPIDLSGDEAHYWDWSRQLDWSYYSKGPVVAYVIRLGCLIFGDNTMGVRVPALVLAMGTSICIWWLTLRMYRSEWLALAAVLLCHVMPIFIAGSLLMTIDAPYFFFWALATCLVYLGIRGNRKWPWAAAGLCIGISFLAKYAALIWIICLLIYLVFQKRQRHWLKTIWPWLTIVIALICTVPVLIWNAQHDWVTFGHVARTTTENQSGGNPLMIINNLALLIASQIGILNPVIFGFMIVAIVTVWKMLKRQGDDLREDLPNPADHAFLLAFSLPFLALVGVVTLFKETEANWPAAAYFTLIPLTVWMIHRSWPRTKGWLIGAIVIGMVAMPVMHYSSYFYPYMPVPPRKWDPSARLYGWREIGHEVSLILHQSDLHQPFILTDKYQMAGLMAFYVEGQPATYCAGSYWSDPKERDRLTQYDMWPDRDLGQGELSGRDAVYVGQERDELSNYFERVEKLPNLPIIRHGVRIREQKLFLCYHFKGMNRPSDGRTRR